ncbi:hypothetical protein MIR68_008980 [Amoeboaphelidium protococcarum]|nr:hypothetical protein MIR68_008980 [Amoeboaphelidium protococcarum]
MAFWSSVKDKDYRAHSGRILCLRWFVHEDGRTLLATGSADNTVKIWHIDSQDGVILRHWTLEGHSGSVQSLDWNSDGARVVSASSDGTCKLWDVDKRCCLASFQSGSKNLNVKFSPSNRYVICGNVKDLVTVLEIVDNDNQWEQVRQRQFDVEVNELQWISQDGNDAFLAMCTGDGSVQIIDFNTWISEDRLDILYKLAGHGASVYNVTVSQDGLYLSSGGADSMVNLWDLQDVVCIRSFAGAQSAVRSLAFSSDGKYLAVASKDYEIQIYSTRSFDLVESIKVKSTVNALHFHPDGNMLAFAGDDLDPRTQKDSGSFHIIRFMK